MLFQSLNISQGKHGKWPRRGEYFTPVEKGSSVLRSPTEIEESLPAEGDYSNMARFDHNTCRLYTSEIFPTKTLI